MEASEDLQTWTPLAVQAAGAGGAAGFEISEPQTTARRFYRVQREPLE